MKAPDCPSCGRHENVKLYKKILKEDDEGEISEYALVYICEGECKTEFYAELSQYGHIQEELHLMARKVDKFNLK